MTMYSKPIASSFTCPRPTVRHLLPALVLLLAACDIPGLDGEKKAAEADAEGRAVGSACRHAMRGIEDCYKQNPKALKSAVFNGWKDMDAYMRENKLEGILPPPPPPPPKPKVVEEEEEVITEKAEPKKAGSKPKGGH